ncbi:hypothetical protein [uncultured Aliiroseovarius sp.]|nr:hypothetical protein [uncultured Aliiroseovarius sp.]
MGSAIDMVICTGLGMVTMTIGPDGEPVDSVHLCPDGAQMFAAEFFVPMIHMPVQQLLARIGPVRAASLGGRTELTPSARGPPLLA